MQVKLLVSRVSVDGAQNRGDIIEVSSAEGARMIKAEQAEPIRSEKRETTAKRAKSEKAAK